MRSAAIETAIETINSMSVLELADLRDRLSERWGVNWQTAMPTPNAVPVGEQPEPEEQTAFDLVLLSHGANKIAVIKAVREITSLGLKEAKALVESAPATISTGHDREWADVWALKLREAGATVEVN